MAWRTLSVGEMVRKGDQFLSHDSGKWVTVCEAFPYRQMCDYKYRRRIPNDKFHRILRPMERVQVGDEWWSVSQSQWIPTIRTNGEQQDVNTPYRRKIVRKQPFAEKLTTAATAAKLPETVERGYALVLAGTPVDLYYDQCRKKGALAHNWVDAKYLNDAMCLNGKQHPDYVYRYPIRPDPGLGYIILSTLEKLVAGDEFWSPERQTWCATGNIIPGTPCKQSKGLYYRRKLQTVKSEGVGSYYYLSPSERVMPGDEFKNSLDEWILLRNIPSCGRSQMEGYKYRRKIDHTEGGKYRLLQKGEPLMPGDEFLPNGQGKTWLPSQNAILAINADANSLYRRRVCNEKPKAVWDSNAAFDAWWNSVKQQWGSCSSAARSAAYVAWREAIKQAKANQ